jgi:hypothetical protein
MQQAGTLPTGYQAPARKRLFSHGNCPIRIFDGTSGNLTNDIFRSRVDDRTNAI